MMKRALSGRLTVCILALILVLPVLPSFVHSADIFEVDADLMDSGPIRIESLKPGTHVNINDGSGSTLLSNMPVSILSDSSAGAKIKRTAEEPDGEPGSGWMYDVLISDQTWFQYNDGFQSMELDPVNQNDLYCIFESWTNHVTGTFQWCLALRRSTNGGETWSPEIWEFAYPSQINGVYPDMKEPDIALGPDGNIWITYSVFAYDGPAKNILDMQIYAQVLPTSSWSTGPWSQYMVSQAFGSPYNYHRLPTITIHQTNNKPIITTLTYDAISSTQSSLIAWQYDTSASVTPWDGWLVDGPVNANYIQHPCMDAGAAGRLYITSMYYYEAGGVFDMVVYQSTNDGLDWTMVGDFYDSANVNSFYKPSIASTKSGTDIVLCAGTYTPDPGDASLGDIGYAFSLNSGGTWDSYTLPLGNYQRMPYVQEDLDKSYFLMSYRQEDGGEVYSTRYAIASTSDLTNWIGPEIASDSGSYQAANWFAHVAVQRRPDGQDYPCIAWSDLRDAATPISQTSDTYVVFSTYGARYTIDTDPTGLDILVDSQTYTAPHIFNWPAGYYHDLEAPLEQNNGGNDYYWQNWSDSGTRAHTVLSDVNDDTITANYSIILEEVISLEAGWNLISLPLVQTNESLTAALGTMTNNWDIVMTYNATDSLNPWRSNNTGAPYSVSTMDTVDHTQGIWIHISGGPGELTVRGTAPQSTTIPLYPGWNLVGYPANTEGYTVGDLYLDNPEVQDVTGYNPVAPYYLEILQFDHVMSRGDGYWMYTDVYTEWTVDW